MAKVILVGTGRIALSHFPQIIAHPGVSGISIVENSFKNKIIFQTLFSQKSVYTLNNLPTASTGDWAFLTVPPSAHFDVGEKLLLKGYNLFVEKPFCGNPLQSERLIQLAKSLNLCCWTGYVYRFMPYIKQLKNILGGLKVESYSISFNGFVGKADKSWRSIDKYGGCIGDYGSHAVNLAIHLFNACKIEQVEKSHKYRVDNFSAILSNDKNLSGKINVDWKNEAYTKANLSVNICHDGGNVLFADKDQIINISDGNEKKYLWRSSGTELSCTYFVRGEEFSDQLDFILSGSIKNNGDLIDQEAHLTNVLLDQILEADF